MIRKADQRDIPAAAALALQLWPSHTQGEFEAEFSELVMNPGGAVFLAYEDDQAVGFAQCQLRHDYVEGTGSSPVGYLEGIFVAESHRRMGYARVLLSACEVWSRQQGCQEFASDCPLDNAESLQFHRSLGFAEAGRIICFTKTL